MAGTDWKQHAACAQHPDLDWFDTDCQLEAAVTICRSCPVQTDCLAYAVEHSQYDGIWGGLWGRILLKQIRGGRGRP
jgi:WhiB family redox-sensing transcriptional regulator